MSQQQVRWAIVGLGQIAQRFASDLQDVVESGYLYAVAARDEIRARQFARHYHCPYAYGSYQKLVNDPMIDVVYVATINPYHKSLVKLCLEHGKHVLVEKPAFTRLEDWDEMAELANDKGLLLLEAMKSMTFPAYQAMCQWIQSQKAVVTSITAAFGSKNPFDPQSRLFNQLLSGGATLDVGVYGLWLYADICRRLRTPIAHPHCDFMQDNRAAQVDETVLFEFSGSIKGHIGASITRDLPREAKILGPELEITIAEKWWNPRTIDIVFHGEHIQLSTPANGGGFEYEIDHVNQLVLEHQLKSQLLPHATSRDVITLMENALRTHGFANLVDVESLT